MNTPNLSPSEATWGRFYHQLHISAMRLRAMMETADSAACEAKTESAASTDQPKVNRRAKHITSSGIQQTSGVIR